MENSENKNSVNLEQKAPEVIKPILKPVLKNNLKKNVLLIGGIFLIVLAGVATGWFLSGNKIGSTPLSKDSVVAPGAKSSSKEAGLEDVSKYGEPATGTLEEGGSAQGEGTFHLTREGGASQTVYLTSTVIDLQAFVGKKVQIWGETFAAKKAGWLMDVVRIVEVE
jgi:hypothetical protein